MWIQNDVTGILQDEFEVICGLEEVIEDNDVT
jgi:hypothetical protein